MAQTESASSALSRELKHEWAAGEMRSNKVKKIATLSARDGGAMDSRLVQRDASGELATGAAASKKAKFRDVKRAVGRPLSAPEIEWIGIPGPSGQEVSHPVVCPIELMEALFLDKDRWAKNIVGDERRIAALWAGLAARDDPLWNGIKEHVTDPRRTLFYGVHGDGAPTHKTDGLFTISSGSITGVGATRDVRQVFSVVRKSMMGDGTVEALFDRFQWSCNVLLAGCFPEFDWKGRRCKRAGQDVKLGGWKVAVAHLRGDWEFYQNVMGFPGPTEVPNMCFRCNASPNIVELLWTNAAKGAGWRPTVRNHAAYLAHLARGGLHLPTLFKILSLRFEGVMMDVLHACDLGVASHLVANVIVECLPFYPGSTDAERTAAVEVDLNDWISPKHRIHGRLTFSRLRTSGDWPKLKAKGADTRHLVPFALHLAEKHNSRSTHDKRRLACCQLMNEFYGHLENGGDFLSSHVLDRLEIISQGFVGVYWKLSREALDKQTRAWKMAPKFHWFCHICELQARHMNPRRFWCYMDEDLQQKIKSIALSCHPRTVVENVLFKWLYLLFGDDVEEEDG